MQRLLARVRDLPPARADALLGAILLVEFQLELALLVPGGLPGRGLIAAGLAGMAGAVAVRRRFPLAATVVTFTVFGLVSGFAASSYSDNLYVPFFSALVIAYSLGAHTEGWRLAAGGLFAAALVTVGTVYDDYQEDAGDYLLGVMLLVAAPLLLGRLVRTRARVNRALHDKAAAVDARRAREAELAVTGERERIADELHDVVAHALSAMVVQAGAARRLVPRDGDRAREAFAAVEDTGREALTEIRRLLGVLRREDEEIALAPQPSLRHVEDLVRRASAAGLPVELAVEGDARPLPAGVDLTAYRVVQQALGTALEPGGAGRAHVAVRYGSDHVEVEVTDDGTGEPDARGLLGTRERVSAYGGQLRAGARREGGHAVSARLPAGGPA
jgi:signal transduction histidine kinase